MIKETRPHIIGVTGRSGSGKSTLVRNIQNHFGKDHVSVHTMDNYYLDRSEQVTDHLGYKNFDLPQSFDRAKFHSDLISLIQGTDLHLPKYEFNNEGDHQFLHILSTPIIIVEGLFIYHYPDIKKLLDLKVIVLLSFELAYQRRLRRDTEERNYKEPEIRHRYYHHVEPAYLRYIDPYVTEMDLIIENEERLHEGEEVLKRHIQALLCPKDQIHNPQ